MAGVRRTWDKEHYAKLMQEREEKGDEDVNRKNSTALKQPSREEFKPADVDAASPMGSQRAFLKSREGKIDVESKVGKIEIINPTDASSSRGAGFWCEVCSCLLKDSASYLDHINGRKREFLPFRGHFASHLFTE